MNIFNILLSEIISPTLLDVKRKLPCEDCAHIDTKVTFNVQGFVIGVGSLFALFLLCCISAKCCRVINHYRNRNALLAGGHQEEEEDAEMGYVLK